MARVEFIRRCHRCPKPRSASTRRGWLYDARHPAVVYALGCTPCLVCRSTTVTISEVHVVSRRRPRDA
jgi:hypothetical protein